VIPVRQPPGGRELDVKTRTRNALQGSLRCPGKRGFALPAGRWRTLPHITASPSKVGDIARTALVLTHFEHGCIAGKTCPDDQPNPALPLKDPGAGQSSLPSCSKAPVRVVRISPA